MAEGLNKPEEIYQRTVTTTVDYGKFRKFPGANIVQMPLLLSGKDEKGNQIDVPRVLMNTFELAVNREDKAGEYPEWLEYRDVSDLIAYDRKDRSSNVQVILTTGNQGITEIGAEALRLYQPNAKLTNDRAIDLTEDDLYMQFKEAGAKKGVIEIPRNKLTSEKLQRILLRHSDEVPEEFAQDKTFTNEHLNWLRKQTGRQDVMNAYLDENTNTAKLRAFYVDRASRGCRSVVYGRFSVDYSYGCLVGIVPEALRGGGGSKKLNESGEVSEKKLITPSLEDFLALGRDYVPDACRKEFEKEARQLYH